MAYTDRFPIVKNFFETKLTADADAGETTLYLENVDSLPAILAGRDYVPLVLRDAGTVREIVYVDAVDNTAGTVTVRRGQENTTPAAWATGTYAYCTVTSDSFQRMRVNGFAPLVTDEGRPSISRTSATTVNIVGDFTAQLEVGMAVRVLSGDTVVEPTDAELGAIHITAVSFSAGVTSVSFQNVALPTKVDGLDLGLSVASAPLYHPDTIVADEDTLTQVQNVLSVSQKFKDELKAEQALVDAEQDVAIAEAKSSADAASEDVTALDTTLRTLIVEELAKYLPLSGGVMTGRLEVPSFVVSPGKGEGGQIDLYGGNKEAQRMCSLDTYNNTIRFIQFPSPDGSITGLHVAQFDMANDLLTWAGVARSVKYMGFPLSRRIDVQAQNGMTYTAPDNGFFSVAASGSVVSESYLSLENTTSMIGNRGTGAGSLFASVPMKKGDTIRLDYAAINSWFYCRFVYGG